MRLWLIKLRSSICLWQGYMASLCLYLLSPIFCPMQAEDSFFMNQWYSQPYRGESHIIGWSTYSIAKVEQCCDKDPWSLDSLLGPKHTLDHVGTRRIGFEYLLLDWFFYNAHTISLYLKYRFYFYLFMCVHVGAPPCVLRSEVNLMSPDCILKNVFLTY